MYHTSELNQANKRSLLQGFSLKDYHPDNFTFYEQQVIDFFVASYHHYSSTKITNEKIASKVGCSTKTVTRATNKLHKSGLITKHQQNRYAPNYFSITKRLKNMIDIYWLKSLSDDSIGILKKHKNKLFVSLRNVPHYIRSYLSLILDNLFINSSPSYAQEGLKKPPKEVKIMEQKQRTMRSQKIPPKKGDWQPPKLDSLEVRILKLRRDIEKGEDNLEKCKNQRFGLGFLQKLLDDKKKELVDLQYESIMIRNSNEKQEVLREYRTDTLEACSA